MRVLIFDPFHGAAGDMITGALLGCGADQEIVIRAMNAVVATPTISRVHRAGIGAIRVETHATVTHRTFSEVMTRLDAAPRRYRQKPLFGHGVSLSGYNMQKSRFTGSMRISMKWGRTMRLPT